MPLRIYFIIASIFICCSSCLATSTEKLVSLKHFGAKGDGKTDDTQAFLRALNAMKKADFSLTGEKLTYLVKGKHAISLKRLVIKDVTFKLPSFQKQFALQISSNDIQFDGVKIEGVRGKMTEEWRVFGKESGVESILPTLDDIFFINAENSAARIKISDFTATNIHARSCITIISFGEVRITDVDFKNISNKTIHVYHTTDDGVTVGGTTFLSRAKAENVGILPQLIRVNGKSYQTTKGQYMPQESFNFITSFGNYYATDIWVTNYGSTGLTADRNNYFEADQVFINNLSSKAYSNNTSAALWFEACKRVHVKSANLKIMARNSKELAFDNSALHIFGHDSSVQIDRLKIVGGKNAVLNKGVRGSLSGKNNITIGSIDIVGKYQTAGVSFGVLDKAASSSKLNFRVLSLANSRADFNSINSITIDELIGADPKQEVNFYIDNQNTGTEKILIGKSNITNFGLSRQVKNFVVKQPASAEKVNFRKLN